MPGPTVKEILLKWGIDNSNWKKSIGELAQLLEKNNKAAEKAQDQSLKKLAEQKAKLKEVIADQKSETAEIEKQIGKLKVKAAASSAAKADSLARLATERAASAEASKQAALQKSLQAAQKTLQQEINTKLMNEKLVTAEINKQNALLRLQVAQQRAAGGGGVPGRAGGGGGHGGGHGGAAAGFLGGFSSRLAGTIGFAVLSAEGLGRVFEQLTEKVKRFVEESGPLEQVREQFEKLSKMKGMDSVKFLEDMRAATHNLVADVELYRTANKFMQSGIKTTEQDLIKLTQATVGLARSQGRDATAAINALNMSLATGRFQRLAYITGLTREEMTVRGLSATMSAHQRIQLQYEHALKKITERYQQFGEPALTVTEVLKQLDTVTTRLFEGFSRGVVQSRGMAAVFEFLRDVISKLSSGEGGVEELGQRFGDIFTVVVEVAKAIGSMASSTWGLWKVLVETFAPTSISDTFITRLTTFAGLMKTGAQAAVLIKGAIAEMALRTEYTIKEAVQPSSLQQFGEKMGAKAAGKPAPVFVDLHKEFETKLKAQYDKEYDELLKLEEAFSKPQKGMELGGAPGKGGTAEDEANIALQRQQRQLRLKGAELDAQIELATEKGKLEKLKQANEEAYNAGLEALDAYIAKKKSYRSTELQDTLNEIGQERKARLAELAEKNKTEVMDPKSYAMSKANIAKESAKKEIDARNAAQRELDALDMKGVVDKLAARKRLAEALETIEKARIARERENTEYEFQQGTMGAQEYLDKKIQFAERDYEATRETEEKKLAENKYSETARAEFSQKMAKAAEEREKSLTKLSLDEIEIRTKAVEQSYDRAQKLIDSQIKYQQTLSQTSYFGGKGEEQSLIEAQVELLKSRLEQEVKSLALTERGSEAWFQQLEKIQATKSALIQYNEELIKARDISTGISSALKEMSQAAGRFPKIGAQRVSKGLETLAGGLEEQERYRHRQATRTAARQARAEGKTIAPVTPEEIFKSLQKVSQAAGEDIGKHLKAASDSVEEWRRKMVASGLALDDGIVKTTKALLGDLIPAIQKVAEAAGGTKPSKYDSGKPHAGSGPSSAGSPLGTATASDMETLQPAWLTSTRSEDSGGGTLGGVSQLVTTGLSMVAQQAKSLHSGFKNLIDVSVGTDGLVGYFKNLGKDSEKASEDLSSFADTVSSIAGEVGGLVSASKGTGGPFQAGMQGMSSGAGLGGQIGSMFGPMGGMIGTAVGAGAGLVIGIFAGKAKKEAENIAKRITAEFNAVLVEVSQGTIGLGKAVESEIATINSAVQQLSGKKGGRDELKQILPQMEQQLQQLQSQQQNIIKSFDKQLEIASAPQASQALVQPIQQIIDTYQQYVLAGGNVELANKYLQDSFRSLVTQGLDQLNQSEQDAINNALNYNDLLLQRQELIQNTNQQIQDIMSRGVAVRQMPEGVTKARELQQLMLKATNQQTQLDQEIAVSKHKLDNESRIFQLATTRVGLETQLVELQNAQTDKADAATQALLREVAAYSQGTPTNLPTALDMIGLGSTYVSPSQEPGLMPQPPVKTGIWEIDLQNQLQYKQALAYYQQQANLSSSAVIPSLGLAGVPGGTMGVTPAGMGTAATSSSAMALGGILDSMASNITSLVQGLSTVFGISLPQAGSTTTTAAKSNVKMAGVSSPSSMRLSGTGMVAAAAPISDVVMAGVQSSTDALVSTTSQRQTIEQNISDLSAARVSNETQLVSLKMKEINADMQRIQAWNDLLKVQVKTSGAQPQTLEDMLQAVYQTRARQGFGGFVGETSNPT